MPRVAHRQVLASLSQSLGTNTSHMAFPKKHTRRLSVDGVEYLWHLNKDWDRRTRWIVVQQLGASVGQLLMVNPYHHDLLPSKGTISEAVRFGLGHGWKPSRKGPPVRLYFAGRDRGFQLCGKPVPVA